MASAVGSSNGTELSVRERIAADAATAQPLALTHGHHQDIGGRKQQEDSCCVVADLNPFVEKLRPELGTGARRAFFAVYDGFGGDFASSWLTRNLHQFVVKDPAFETDPLQALESAFAAADTELLRIMKALDDKVGSKSAAHQRVGSCASVALVINNELFIASVGDSRAVLYARKRGFPPDPLTVDHKPGSDSERERIIAAGATVEQKTCEQAGCLCFSAKVVPLGPHRIKPGGLAVSRAFGAGHAKLPELGGIEGGLLVKPHLRHVRLTADDLCILICSDGVWDNCSPAHLQTSLRTHIYDAVDFKLCARYAASDTVSQSLKRSVDVVTQDNTSAVVVVVGSQKR